MVGHTHEDIDKVFSRVSAHLKKNSVYILEGEYTKIVVGMLAVCVWALSFCLHPRVGASFFNFVLHRLLFKIPFTFSLKVLKEAVWISNQEVTSVKQLSAMYDYMTWLKPFINTPHNHTAPHNFLFRCNVSGSAEMLYQNWSTDEWLPQTPNDGLKVFMHEFIYRSESL